MHVLPNAEMIFINNIASHFGGAIAAENFRGGNDTALILNNFCFIQYDIGGEHEYKPDDWKVYNNVYFIHGTMMCVVGNYSQHLIPLTS